MFKTATGRLYTFLAACKPENTKIKKRLLITEIIEMPEYKSLEADQNARSTIDDYYSIEILQDRSFSELQEIKKIIPFMEDCIRKLYETICYGDARKLPKIESASFYDSKAMKTLYEFVSTVPKEGINITNIPNYEVWTVFSTDAVLSVDQVTDLFDATNMNDLELIIPEKLSGYSFCISSAEIQEKRKTYRSIFQKEETLRIRIQIVDNKIYMKKILLSILSIIFVLPQFCGSQELLGVNESIISLLIYMAAVGAFWILG